MAREKLRIAKEISLPSDAITQTMAAIGRKGSGKTYLSQMIAEQMLDAKAQVVVIDPVGNWWGLRVNADGHSKGKQIFVIGGDHGDVPLVPEAGKRIAQLIVEKGIPAVIDVSGFGIGERKRFCADFGEEFFQLKKKRRSPVHIFLEEAQLIVPQNIRPEEARMYSSFEQIVRLGRNYGIGCTLITQRPQSVNKEVLSQVECLCVLQITGPHERKAIEYWVQEAGADRALVGELPGLERGEGYVWSPSWMRVYQRVHFAKKQTFDASATPEIGKKTRAASLSAVDVDALKRDIADVVEQAEKDDPVALRRRISALETDSRKKPVVDPAAMQKAIDTAVRIAESKLQKEFDDERASYRFALANASNVLKKIAELTNRPDVAALTKIPIHTAKTKEIDARTEAKPERPSHTEAAPVSDRLPADTSISSSMQRILDALALLETVGKSPAEKDQVALLSDQRPTSGGYFNNLGALRSGGFIVYPTPGNVQLTNAGREAARPAQISSNADMHDLVRGKLSSPQKRMFDALISIYPADMSKDDLAKETQQKETSGGYFNNLGTMRTLGVLDYPSPGRVRATDILFPL